MDEKDPIAFVAMMNGMTREEFLFQVQAEIDSLPLEEWAKFGGKPTAEEYVRAIGCKIIAELEERDMMMESEGGILS